MPTADNLMTSVNRVLALICLLLLAAYAPAQGHSGTKVHVKRAAIQQVADQQMLVVQLTIDAPYHIYSVDSKDDHAASATKLSVNKPYEIAGKLTESTPIHHKKDYLDEDKNPIYSEEYEKHEGEVTLKVPVKGSGAGPLKGSIRVIACDNEKCLPDGEVAFTATAEGGGGTVHAQAPDTRQGHGPSAPDTRVTPAPASRPARKVILNPTRTGKIPEDDPVKVVEISYPDPITSDRFDLRVVVDIGKDYHIYAFSKAITGIPTTFTFSKPGGAAPAVVIAQNGDVKPDPKPRHRKKAFEDYEYFEGQVAFDVPMRAAWSAGKTGSNGGGEVSFPFTLTVGYQSCTMQHCLLPAEATFELTATATPAADWVVENPAAECHALSVVVTSDPATLRPDSKAMLVARIRRADGKACPPDLGPAKFELGTGRNLSVDESRSTTSTAEPDGSVTLRLPIEVSGDAEDGTVAISGRVALGASAADFTGNVKVMAPLLGFLLIAALAALGALLTPCVFPMIPVTMSFFTKQAESGTSHPAKLGFVYSAGIIVSFTLIGALFTAVLSGDAANQFAGHWITQIVIAALFVFFALSLLGMFDLSVPQPIMQMVERTTTRRMELVEKGQGITIAVLLMGLLFSITTFTCTAPFIGGLLASASSSGQYTRPILGMLAFSTVLAIPFFFLAVFPSQLKKLPKAGGWLNETKVVMGFVELAAAVKFINGADYTLGWNIFTRNVCLACWIALFGLTGLYLIGLIRLPKDMPRQKTGVIPLLISTLFLTVAIYLATGLNGKPLGKFVEGWLPPIEDEFRESAYLSSNHPLADSGSEGRTGWANHFVDDYPGALAEARRLDVPLFLDFTGYNCANCRSVEAVIFEKNKEIKEALRKFVMVSLHLDGGGVPEKTNGELRERLGIPPSMPTYVVLDPTYSTPITSWGSHSADPGKWRAQVKDALQRWETLKKR
jgi:thiol:disulfide interchange protein DsbD